MNLQLLLTGLLKPSYISEREPSFLQQADTVCRFLEKSDCARFKRLQYQAFLCNESFECSCSSDPTCSQYCNSL